MSLLPALALLSTTAFAPQLDQVYEFVQQNLIGHETTQDVLRTGKDTLPDGTRVEWEAVDFHEFTGCVDRRADSGALTEGGFECTQRIGTRSITWTLDADDRRVGEGREKTRFYDIVFVVGLRLASATLSGYLTEKASPGYVQRTQWHLDEAGALHVTSSMAGVGSITCGWQPHDDSGRSTFPCAPESETVFTAHDGKVTEAMTSALWEVDDASLAKVRLERKEFSTLSEH